MRDNEEKVKLVDDTYKKIGENVIPCVRQVITTGKMYAKSVQGTLIASRAYTEALTRIGAAAQNSMWGGAVDIGTALIHLVEVNRQILDQQALLMQVLNAEFLEPLEDSLEKDQKLVAKEQKAFQQEYKKHKDTYHNTLKKCKKKSTRKSFNEDTMFKLADEARYRLDVFCDDSLKEVILQERRRYGFILDRQCSIARRLADYNFKGHALIHQHINEWEEVAGTRHTLPETFSAVLPQDIEQAAHLTGHGTLVYEDSEYAYVQQHSRKNSDPSMIRNQDKDIANHPMLRSKSEYNLSATNGDDYSLPQDAVPPERSSSPNRHNGSSDASNVRVKYPYTANGHHELSLQKGDLIKVLADSDDMESGWQFGENLTTGRRGWFPSTYTEHILDKVPPPPPPHISSSTLPRQMNGLNRYKYSSEVDLAPDPRKSLKSTSSSQLYAEGLGSRRRPLPATPPRIPDFHSLSGHYSTTDILQNGSSHNLKDIYGRHSMHPPRPEGGPHIRSNISQYQGVAL